MASLEFSTSDEGSSLLARKKNGDGCKADAGSVCDQGQSEARHCVAAIRDTCYRAAAAHVLRSGQNERDVRFSVED